MNEVEQIEKAQEHFAGLKKALKQIMKINAEAGRDEAANAAMKAYGKIIVAHAESTEDLNKYYKNEIEEGLIQTFGGGGGR